MPLPYHLIDGYNLLHAADLARKTYGPGDLERARFGLLVRVAEGMSDSARSRTTVVFDAADPPPFADRHFRFREIEVLFAVETGDADATIEKLIRLHASPRQLRVVSDDIRLQTAARRRGAQAVKSEAFLRRLSRGSHLEPQSDARSVDSLDDVRIESWLDFFGMDAGAIPTAPTDSPPAPVRRNEAAPRRSPDDSVPRERREATDPPASPNPTEDSSEIEASPPADDLTFWQRRIEDVISEEQHSSRRRPDAG